MSSKSFRSQSGSTVLYVILAVVIVFLGINLSADNSSSNWGESIKNWANTNLTLQKFSTSNSTKNEPSSTRTLELVEEESETISVVEENSPSVVAVVEESLAFSYFGEAQLTESSIGTGFAIEPDTFVTNRHVVSDTSSKYKIVDRDGNEYEVTEILRDSRNDLAIIKIKDGNFPVLSLGDSEEIKVGQTVIAIGNALGQFSNTVTKGIISGKGRGIVASSSLGQFQEEIENLLQTDAALNPGNSGGPLMNLGGQVIGVNVAVSVGSENIGFAIPSNTVQDLINDYQAGVDRRRPLLGVRYNIVTEEISKSLGIPEGAYIRDVINGGPADTAGLKTNDVILSFDGVAIKGDVTLEDQIINKKVGDKVELEIWRDNKTSKISVTLDASDE